MPYAFPTAPPGLFKLDGNKPAPHGYGINAGDPQARGLRRFYPFWLGAGPQTQDLVDPAGRNHGTRNNAPWATSEKGTVLRFGADGTDWLTTSFAESFAEWTVICYCNSTISSNGVDPIFGESAETNRNVVGWLRSSGQQYIQYNDFFFDSEDWGVEADIAGWRLWSWSLRGGSDFRVGRDNEFASGATNGASSGVVTWTSITRIGGNAAGPAGQGTFGGDVALIAVYDRFLTESEVLTYVANPFFLITPESQVVSVVEVAVGPGEIMAALEPQFALHAPAPLVPVPYF